MKLLIYCIKMCLVYYGVLRANETLVANKLNKSNSTVIAVQVEASLHEQLH